MLKPKTKVDYTNPDLDNCRFRMQSELNNCSEPLQILHQLERIFICELTTKKSEQRPNVYSSDEHF